MTPAQMTPDLLNLVWSAALCIVLWVPYIVARATIWGLPAAMGYPENPPELPKWVGRSVRAHMNLVENIGPFAVLVLVAHIGGMASETTALGAALFFWARIVQSIVHIAGIPYVRTGAFVVGWVGMAMILFEIVL